MTTSWCLTEPTPTLKDVCYNLNFYKLDQAKTYKTKAKHAAKHMYKHAKITNSSLSEDVAGVRRPFVIFSPT